MTVEKFIRILGYVVYVMLWSPVIAIILLVMPVIWLRMTSRLGFTMRESMTLYVECMKNSIQHDINFIQTGIW
jgi:hypothetical protein